MIKSELIAQLAAENPHLTQKDVERVVKNGGRPDWKEWEEAEGGGCALMQGVVGPYCELARQCWQPRPTVKL